MVFTEKKPKDFFQKGANLIKAISLRKHSSIGAVATEREVK